MIEGITKTGFIYEIEEDRLYNYELIELLEEVDSSPLALPKVVNILLGKEQAKELKDHVRSKDGIVTVDKMAEELQEIFLQQAEIKKS